MADDISNDNDDKGGVGAGHIVAGGVTGLGAGLGTAHFMVGKPEEVRAELTKAQAELARIQAEHKTAVANAQSKVIATTEGRKLYTDHAQATLKLSMAKTAHEQAENNALSNWVNKGSPEAIASKDGKLIAASIKEAQNYSDAAKGVKSTQENIDKITDAIKKKYETESKASLGKLEEEAKAAFKNQILDTHKDMFGNKATGKPVGAFRLQELNDFIENHEAIEEALKAGNLKKAEEVRGWMKETLVDWGVPESEHKRILATLDGICEDYRKIKVDPANLEADMQAAIATNTRGLKAQLAEHQEVLNKLASQKAAAVDTVVSKAKTELDAAETAAKSSQQAIDSAIAVHAGKEVGAIKAAEKTVEKLAKKAGILEGEGSAIMKGLKTRAGMIAGVTALGAVAGAGVYHLLFGSKKEENTRWRDQVTQQRAAAANVNSQGVAPGAA